MHIIKIHSVVFCRLRRLFYILIVFFVSAQVEQLRATDECPVEYLLHDEQDGKKYIHTLLRLMGGATSDARAQHFAVSR